MPNGGSDCCGTCWFNTVNNGNPGHPRGKKVKAIRCEIRNFTPEIPFWTYCANHPHHNPGKSRVPIGPVYVCAEGSYGRVEKIKPLDSEEVRKELVRLAEQIPEIPSSLCPSKSLEILEALGFSLSFSVADIQNVA